MKNTFNVLFYVKKQGKKNGLLPIMVRVTVNGRPIQFFTQLSVDPLTMEWDSKGQKVKGKGVSMINNQLRNIDAGIRTKYHELLQNGEPLTAERVKTAYLGLEESSNMILEIFKEHNEQQKALLGVRRSLSTYRRFVLVYNRLEEFIKKKHHRSDMCVVEINADFVDQFADYLFTTYKLSNNTGQKLMQIFKKITNTCIKKGLLRKDPFMNYSTALETIDPNYLTLDELKLIIKKRFTIKRLEVVKDLFIFSCFTGLAFVDAMNLKHSNITVSNDGKMWIKAYRQKTNQPSIIPVMDVVKSIIEKYKTPGNDRVLPISCHQRVNAYLKEIADCCGIEKNLTFHMARHTYATTAMSFGVPLPTIAKTMGHTNMKMTQHYARVLPEKIINDISALNNATQQIQTLYQ